jgi:hypothetical protein
MERKLGNAKGMLSGWWHTVRIVSPSTTVSINGANAATWSGFRKDFYRDHAAGRRLPPWFSGCYLLFGSTWLARFAPLFQPRRAWLLTVAGEYAIPRLDNCHLGNAAEPGGCARSHPRVPCAAR